MENRWKNLLFIQMEHLNIQETESGVAEVSNIINDPIIMQSPSPPRASTSPLPPDALSVLILPPASAPPLAQTTRSSQRQEPRSPQSATATPRRLRARLRRNRRTTPFDRATGEFVAVEQRRLQLEEQWEQRLHEREIERLRLEDQRDRRLHERETERLQVERQRIEVAREHNRALQQLCTIADNVFGALSEMRRTRGRIV